MHKRVSGETNAWCTLARGGGRERRRREARARMHERHGGAIGMLTPARAHVPRRRRRGAVAVPQLPGLRH